MSATRVHVAAANDDPGGRGVPITVNTTSAASTTSADTTSAHSAIDVRRPFSRRPRPLRLVPVPARGGDTRETVRLPHRLAHAGIRAAPGLESTAYRIAHLLAQVLVWARPAHNAAGVTTPQAFEAVAEARGALAPRGGTGNGSHPPRVGHVRVCQPAEQVAEVAAVVWCSDGAFALALRLERRREQWRCTTIETSIRTPRRQGH